MIGVVPSSFFAVLTGPVGVGKTFQVERLLRAEVAGEPVAAPALYVLAEASAEGTAGETLLDDARALVWPAADCEDALEALRACFPLSGPVTLGTARQRLHEVLCRRADADKQPRPPAPEPSRRDHVTMRAAVVDTMSTLYKGSVATGRRKIIEETDPKHRGRAGKKGASYNDDRQGHQYAARHCKDLIDALNGATRHRGMVVLVSVHTKGATKVITTGEGASAETTEMVIGEAPDLGGVKRVQDGITATSYSETWNCLAAKANVVWHCFASAPDLRRAGPGDVNSEADAFGDRHGVITRRGTYPRSGEVMWVKRQGGEGPLGVFASLPAVWHQDYPCDPAIERISKTPDLGLVLATAVTSWRAEQSSKAGAT